MKRSMLCAALAALAIAGGATSAMAQATEPYLGQIIVVGFNFCPYRWLPANGQLLPISQYTALFALYGTTFGGNGQTNFALPNLQGATPLGEGSGPGLPDVVLGETLGSPTTTLVTTEMPAHNHGLMASTATPAAPTPNNNYFATFASQPVYSAASATPNTPMYPMSTTVAGSGIPFGQYQPTLTLLYCLSTYGVFPSRP